MLRSIIKYGGLALVVLGIILVMKNLFTSDKYNDKGTDKKNKSGYSNVVSNKTYSASISLLDEESKSFVSGASLVLKDKDGNVISSWNSDNGVHLVSSLKNGTYTLIEESAPEGYHLNEKTITFEIKNKDKSVKMYNKKMTKEEKEAYEASMRAKNTTSNEINVDNTLSSKDITMVVTAISSIIFGLALIFYKKEA